MRPLVDAYGADFQPVLWAASELAECGHLDTAEAILTTALDAAQRSGNRREFSVATAIRGIHSAWQGKFDRAEADARAALHSAMASGSRVGVRGAMIPLVWSLTGRGAYQEIEAELAAHGLEHAVGTAIVIDGNLLVARANLRRCEGRFADARDDILRVIGLVPTFNPLGRISVWAPRMLAVTGHREQGIELAARAVARGVRTRATHRCARAGQTCARGADRRGRAATWQRYGVLLGEHGQRCHGMRNRGGLRSSFCSASHPANSSASRRAGISTRRGWLTM